MVKISLARLLKVKPQAAKKFITVLSGSAIKKGDVVAKRKGFFGKEIVIKSRIDGLVDHYSSDTGELVIKTGSTEKQNLADTENTEKSNTGNIETPAPVGARQAQKKTEDIDPLAGGESTEKKVSDKVSKTPAPVGARQAPKIVKNKVKGIFGFGKGEGKLEICEDCLEFTKVNKDDAGKIILCKTISSNTVLYKASALGVEGLAVLYCRFRPKSKDIGFLVLSDKQDNSLWQRIKKWKGKMVQVEEGEIGLISDS